MKRKSIYNIIAVLFLVSVFSVACTKKNSEVRLSPKLSTSQVLNVTSDSATVVGFVIAQGSGLESKGVCYDTAAHPTVDNNKVMYTGDSSKATFHVVLSGLHYATKYYARAFAVISTGPIYGEEFSFTTLPVVPTLTTDTITTDSITGNSAFGGGSVTVSGGATVTARGVCFGTAHLPTVSNGKTVDGDGMGAFTSKLTGLKGNTTYYVRAYATNSAGTGYGPEVSFKTLVDFPQVTTAPVDSITKTSAVIGGKLEYDGGGTITERGLVWSTNADPTVNNNKIVDNGTDSTFSYKLTGLTKNTTYHVRAYAINSAGTTYGDDVAFKTLGDIVTLYIAGDFQGWDPANATDSLMNDNANLIVRGYAYISTTGGFKFTSEHSWNGTNYGAGATTGTLSTDPSAGNLNVSTPGYYQFNVDLTNMTYTDLLTNWGVIGDATGDATWSTDQMMTYSPLLKCWFVTIPMTSGSFKFRANQDWGLNYGASGTAGVLEENSSTNLTVSSDGTYSVILNLSQPLYYTYALTTWSIIGSSTPGGDWSTDIDLTPHSNNTWTVTANLTQGEFKFRANHDWGTSLGDNGTSGELGWNNAGANITVPANGNYTITLDLANGTYTLTKN